MHFAESINTGFAFLAPWLVGAPILGLLINLIFGRRFSEGLIGTVASLASGATFEQAARLANYAGGIVVMKRGTATVSAEELLAAVG